ncbi:H2A protein, partial [Dicrurus megarhynchus]|nr:H2A protein [Dicrurus megarhynchus]
KKSKKFKSRSDRAGLLFPVGRVHRALRKGGYASRIGATAPVYLAAVLQYLLLEVLELAGDMVLANGKKRITPRDVQLAIRNDSELGDLLSNVMIAEGGVMPNIQSALLSK